MTIYTRDIADRVIELYGQGHSLKEIEQTLNISKGIIANWVATKRDSGYIAQAMDDAQIVRHKALQERVSEISEHKQDDDVIFWTDKDGIRHPYAHSAHVGRGNLKLKCALAELGRIDKRVESRVDIVGFSELKTSAEMLTFITERYESGRITYAQYERLLQAVDLKARSEEAEKIKSEMSDIRRLIKAQSQQTDTDISQESGDAQASD